MASIYDIKPRFQALLRPLTNKLAAMGVTANQVTLAAAVISLATGVAIYLGREHRQILLLLPVVLFVRMALNAIDGMLAREHNMKSRLGAILNELGDVFSDSALYLPLACVHGFRPLLVVLIVLLAAMAEMAGVVAVQVGASRRYDGPIDRNRVRHLVVAGSEVEEFSVELPVRARVIRTSLVEARVVASVRL